MKNKLNRDAFEKIYIENYKNVYWTCISFLKNEADAEDVTQSTFIKAYEAWDTLEDESKASAWIKKIAANQCLDLLRTKKNISFDESIEADDSVENEELIDENFLPDDYALNNEKREIVMKIIKENLSDEQFRTVLMFYFNEMSLEEIADAVNIPKGTVKSRLNISRKRIKEGVEKYERESKDKLLITVPFLVLLFKEMAEEQSCSIRQISVFLQTALSSGSLAETSGVLVAEAAAKGAVSSAAKGIIVKIAVAIGAAALVGSVAAAAVFYNRNDDDDLNRGETVSQNIDDITISENNNQDSYVQGTDVTGVSGDYISGADVTGVSDESLSGGVSADSVPINYEYYPGGIVDFDNMIFYVDENAFKVEEATVQDFLDAGYLSLLSDQMEQLSSLEKIDIPLFIEDDEPYVYVHFSNRTDTEIPLNEYVFSGFEYLYYDDYNGPWRVSTNFSDISDLEEWVNDFKEHNSFSEYYGADVSDGDCDIIGEHIEYEGDETIRIEYDLEVHDGIMYYSRVVWNYE